MSMKRFTKPSKPLMSQRSVLSGGAENLTIQSSRMPLESKLPSSSPKEILKPLTS